MRRQCSGYSGAAGPFAFSSFLGLAKQLGSCNTGFAKIALPFTARSQEEGRFDQTGRALQWGKLDAKTDKISRCEISYGRGPFARMIIVIISKTAPSAAAADPCRLGDISSLGSRPQEPGLTAQAAQRESRAPGESCAQEESFAVR